MTAIINIDDSMLIAVQEKLKEIPNKAPNAISMSLNRTVTNVASNLSKEVRKEYSVKAGDVKSKGGIKKIMANPGSLGAAVKSNGGVIGLDHFKTSNLMSTSRKGGVKSVSLNKKAVKAEVKKGQMKTVLGGFVATMNGPKIYKRKTKKRLPIKRLFGPSVPQMAGNEKVAEVINTEAAKTFDKRLEQNIKYLLDKL